VIQIFLLYRKDRLRWIFDVFIAQLLDIIFHGGILLIASFPTSFGHGFLVHFFERDALMVVVKFKDGHSRAAARTFITPLPNL